MRDGVDRPLQMQAQLCHTGVDFFGPGETQKRAVIVLSQRAKVHLLKVKAKKALFFNQPGVHQCQKLLIEMCIRDRW